MRDTENTIDEESMGNALDAEASAQEDAAPYDAAPYDAAPEVIPVPWGGLLFVDPSGRPLMKIAPTEQGGALFLFDSAGNLVASMHAGGEGTGHIAAIHGCEMVAGLHSGAAGGIVQASTSAGVAASTMGSSEAGGLITTYGPDGEIIEQLCPSGKNTLGGIALPRKTYVN